MPFPANHKLLPGICQNDKILLSSNSNWRIGSDHNTSIIVSDLKNNIQQIFKTDIQTGTVRGQHLFIDYDKNKKLFILKDNSSHGSTYIELITQKKYLIENGTIITIFYLVPARVNNEPVMKEKTVDLTFLNIKWDS